MSTPISSPPNSLLDRLRAWSRSPRWPERLLFAVGALLRLRLHESYDPRWGYDITPHFDYVAYLARTHELPPLAHDREAGNPPLFYELAAMVLRGGGSMEDIQWISIVAGTVTLALTWHALGSIFPNDRIARSTGLALAAVLPCSVHIAGLFSNEALLGTFATGALIFLHRGFSASGRARWSWFGLFGLAYALSLSTKVSPMVFAFAVALGIAVDARATITEGLRRVVARIAPASCGLCLGLAIGVPILARHYPTTGIVFPTGYDSMSVGGVDDIPVWRRRPLGFYVLPCAEEIVTRPYYPSCSKPRARFWPVLVATTFGDYYNVRYGGLPHGDEPTELANGRLLPVRMRRGAQAALIAGVPIALLTAVAFVVTFARELRAKRAATVATLAASLLALAGQIALSVRWPYDGFGPIKGSYLQFAAAPLFVVYGGTVSWLFRHPKLRGAAVLQWVALTVVAAYSVLARWNGFYDP